MMESELALAGSGAAAAPLVRAAGAEDFDARDLAPESGWKSRLLGAVLDEPQWLFALLRLLWPIPYSRRLNWAAATRYDDVREVLAQDRVFAVPFGDKVMELNGGPNFLLGMEDGAEYRRYEAQVMRAFRREDVATRVAPLAARFAREIVARSFGRLDAVEGLVTLVPTLICEAYFGVAVPDKREFGQWTIAMSTFLFGDPTDKPAYRRAALAAGARVRPLVDAAIAAAKEAPDGADTVTARLVAMQAEGAEGLSDAVIGAFLIGMITGFVPTNTMAAGHMLEMLLRRPEFMAAAREAALADDDERLKRCLFEAMRFKPLNPGPFRVCREDFTIAAGTPRARRIPAGTKLLAGTQSAMFDARRVAAPRRFDPDRPRHDYMLFGQGLHWCVGAFIAEAQITQTLKPLLRRPGLRRAAGEDGRLARLGPFPAHLFVEFEP
jgi:cytochrome P450